jgi:EAL domain-containing protein (putative c-di-GMP-specific phosphodiesterase class I)
VAFRHERFLEGLALTLKETGLEPRYPELEMTERIRQTKKPLIRAAPSFTILIR